MFNKDLLGIPDFKNPNSLGLEGEDHINVSIESSLPIGKMLYPGYVKIIDYPFIGKFKSVISLSYWLKYGCTNDDIRRLTGNNLVNYIKKNDTMSNKINNYKAIVGLATWIKIKSYPEHLETLKQLDDKIKLVSYNIVKSSGLRITTGYANLTLEIIENIVKDIKNDKEPNFNRYITKGKSKDLFYLEDVLKIILTSDKIEELRKTQYSIVI